MTGDFWLDWAALAVSLFNTILLLWLGITVLSNADRRSWGIWLASSGLLFSGAFFLIHSAILGRGLRDLSPEMDLGWHLGWFPILAAPLAWYVVVLWYSGFWESAHSSSLRRRQFVWFVLTLMMAIGLALFLLVANPLPSFSQILQLELSDTPDGGSIPLFIGIYSLYNVLCISFSLDALRRPEPSARMMGEAARRRARPYLIAASIVLLLVSVLVAAFAFEIVLPAQSRAARIDLTSLVAAFDLIIAALIAVAVILIGTAVVSYEIFTGKSLPRRDFWRQWRGAVILAAGFSIVLAGSVTAQLHPIYALLLATLILTTFYALSSVRAFAERERYMQQLRPWVSSQRLYEHLLTPSTPPELDVAAPFRALCENVLNARSAYLTAVGPLASLVSPALVYPSHATPPDLSLSELVSRLNSPETMCLAVEPEQYAGAQWAVPLWSERGLIGVLLLGEKRDGGLYAQEEIEIARASGERLIDTQASAELARRLIALQRQRLAESQVIDRRARRVLHDDILPQLHTAMLTLNPEREAEAIQLLAQAHREISELLRDMPAPAAKPLERAGIIGALRGVIHRELADAFDGVDWQIEPEVEHRAQAIPPLTAEVIFYAAREAIRNAARYGRDGNAARVLHLRIGARWREGLELFIEDDGVGIGSGTYAQNGSGSGLALHSTLVAVVGGSLAAERTDGAHTRVTIKLPQPGPNARS